MKRENTLWRTGNFIIANVDGILSAVATGKQSGDYVWSFSVGEKDHQRYQGICNDLSDDGLFGFKKK